MIKTSIGYPRISLTVPSIVIMVPGLYLYRAIYNIGITSINTGAFWFTEALLIIIDVYKRQFLILVDILLFCHNHR